MKAVQAGGSRAAAWGSSIPPLHFHQPSRAAPCFAPALRQGKPGASASASAHRPPGEVVVVAGTAGRLWEAEG